MDTRNREFTYFPGLNGLRCIGAGFVLVSHLEQIKEDFGLTPHYWNFTQNKFGTITFLVLSGFLISHLLFSEKQKQGTIRIGRFYLKRILRIWPVYYIIVLSSLFVLNRIDFFEIPVKSVQVYENFGEKVLLYVIMLPNLLMIPYAAHTWTIGLIEQFYVVYPIIIQYLKKTGILLLLLVVTILSPDIFATIPFSTYFSSYPRLLIIVNLLADFSFSFSCIAIGCMAYLLYWRRPAWLQVLYKPVIQVTSVMMLGFFLFFSPDFHFVTDNRVYAILLSVILLNVATNQHPIIRLENKVFQFLGKISYGLYMYHPITIVIALQLLKIGMPVKIGMPGNAGETTFNILLYGAAILLTILIATLSYYYIELPFLKLKGTFAERNRSSAVSGKTTGRQAKPLNNSILTG